MIYGVNRYKLYYICIKTDIMKINQWEKSRYQKSFDYKICDIVPVKIIFFGYAKNDPVIAKKILILLSRTFDSFEST